jgi:hypothetical protein
MRRIGNMANGNVIRGRLCRHSTAFLTASIPISNRKSGIRIPRKLWGISEVQVSNRKYFAVFYRGFCRSSRFLIYGSAIKYPRKALKT